MFTTSFGSGYAARFSSGNCLKPRVRYGPRSSPSQLGSTDTTQSTTQQTRFKVQVLWFGSADSVDPSQTRSIR
ncbi:hypothetical protein Hdeb2414_s0009g00317911 [Helianthus debilis subsp. tardiflorus]